MELRVDKQWFDGSHPTDPKGLRARDLGLAGILGGPFRRVIEANFLQPVVEIRQPPGSWRLDKVHITPLAPEEKQPRLFVGEFKAAGAASCSSSPTTLSRFTTRRISTRPSWGSTPAARS